MGTYQSYRVHYCVFFLGLLASIPAARMPRSAIWIQSHRHDYIPLMGIRFEMILDDLQLYYPDGRPFESYPEVMKQRALAEQERDQVKAQLGLERTRANREQQRAELAESQLEQERQQRLNLIKQLSSTLTPEQLKALGVDPEKSN